MPTDKKKHFAAGLAIAVLVYPLLGLLSAFLAAAAIGVGKEFYDLQHMPEKTPELWDVVATVAGALPVAVFHLWIG